METKTMRAVSCVAGSLVLFAAIRAGTAKTMAAEGNDSKAAPPEKAEKLWNQRAAATYLDQRERWWMGWQDAAREHGTFCISCHTAVPYALARPALRAAIGEKAPNELEQALIENATKRVRLWNELAPVYNDKDAGPNKSAESRATEAVLLALTLASNDAQSGKLSDDTRRAFQNLWALQQTAGPARG